MRYILYRLENSALMFDFSVIKHLRFLELNSTFHFRLTFASVSMNGAAVSLASMSAVSRSGRRCREAAEPR